MPPQDILLCCLIAKSRIVLNAVCHNMSKNNKEISAELHLFASQHEVLFFCVSTVCYLPPCGVKSGDGLCIRDKLP